MNTVDIKEAYNTLETYLMHLLLKKAIKVTYKANAHKMSTKAN